MEEIRVIGVDEAGRGSLIGPLVVSGCSVPIGLLHKLRELGVKDSKKLSPNKRKELFEQIKGLKEIKLLSFKIKPHLIDSYVWSKEKGVNLNYLEAVYMAKIIDRLPGILAVVDAADANESNFLKMVSENMRSKKSVVSAHHADENYVVVSAASIVAKVTRDLEVEKIRKRFGDFGSGYPSDRRTIDFIRSVSNPEVYRFIRLSWKTLYKNKSIHSL